MNYEKGEPSLGLRNRPVSDHSSVCSRFVGSYKRRKQEQRRRLSKSPNDLSKYSLDEREFANRSLSIKSHRSAPKVSGSDLHLNGGNLHKRNDVSVGFTKSSDFQRPFVVPYGCHVESAELGSGNTSCRSHRKERPDGTGRMLGTKIQTIKEIHANGEITLKSIDEQLEIWKNLKSSHQTDVPTSTFNSQQVSSVRAKPDRFSVANIRNSSRNAISVDDPSSSTLENKMSNHVMWSQDSIDQVLCKSKRLNAESSRRITSFTKKLAQRDQSNVRSKYSCNSDLLFAKTDRNHVLRTETDVDTVMSQVESSRRKRRARQSSSRYDTELQSRICLDRNLTFVNSTSQFSFDDKRVRRPINHETWAANKKSPPTDYGNLNVLAEINCEDKNFSYSHNSDDTIGNPLNIGGEGKDVWEQTVKKETVVSFNKFRGQECQEDEVQGGNIVQMSRFHNSPKKRHSWRRFNKAALTHKTSAQPTCCNEYPIDDWEWKNDVKQCHNSLQGNFDFNNSDSQFDVSSQTLDIYCGNQLDANLQTRSQVSTSGGSVGVEARNSVTDDDAVWTCTRWTDQIKKIKTKEVNEPQWAYEMYSDICQETMTVPVDMRVEDSICQERFADMENIFDSSTKKPERCWRNSSNYPSAETSRNTEHVAKNISFDPNLGAEFNMKLLPNYYKTWMGCSLLAASDESITNSRNQMTNMVVRNNGLEKMESTSEISSDRCIRIETSSKDMCINDVCSIAVEIDACYTQPELTAHEKLSDRSYFQTNEHGNESSKEQDLIVDFHAVGQSSGDVLCSQQDPVKEDIVLMKTVHSIKEDIESVLQMLNTLEAKKDHMDVNTEPSLKRNSLDSDDPKVKVDTIANVNCATDYVKRAFQKLLSFKNTFVANNEQEEDEDNAHSYEEYIKGKEDYMSNIQSKEETFDVEVIYPSKLVQTTSFTEMRNTKDDGPLTTKVSEYSQRADMFDCDNKGPVTSQMDSPSLNDENRTRRRLNKKQEHQTELTVNEEEPDNDENEEYMWQRDEGKKADTSAQQNTRIRDDTLPVVVSNELKRGILDFSKRRNFDSSPQTSTKKNQTNLDDISSHNKSLDHQRPCESHQLFASPKNVSSSEQNSRAKLHRRRKINTSSSTKTHKKEKLLNKGSQADAHSVSGNRRITIKGGLSNLNKSVENAERYLEAKATQKGSFSSPSDTDIKAAIAFNRASKDNYSHEERNLTHDFIQKGDDEISLRSSKKKMTVSNSEDEQKRSPSVKSKRSVQIICKTIVQTPTPKASLEDLFDEDPEILPEHFNSGGKNSPYKMSETEMYVNKYMYSNENSDIKKQQDRTKGQSTQTLIPTVPNADVRYHNPDQRVRRTSRKNRISRTRRQSTAPFDVDSSKLSSSDTSLLRNSPSSRKGKKKKSQKHEDEIDDNTQIENNENLLPSFYNPKMQHSPKSTVSRPRIDEQSRNKHATPQFIDIAEISSDEVNIKDISHTNEFDYYNEKMACVLPDYKTHAILQRKHRNASSNTEREREDNISNISPTNINTAELNLSIKKLYEEISKLRMQLQASSDETVIRPMPVVETPAGTLQYARSYKAISDFTPQTQDLQKRRKTIENVSCKSINNFFETIFASGQMDVAPESLYEQMTMSQDSYNSRHRSSLLKPIAEVDNDEHGQNRINLEDEINGLVSNNIHRQNHEQKAPIDAMLVSDLESDSPDVVKYSDHVDNMDISQSENELFAIAGQENPSCWRNDDVYVTAPCDISDKNDTQFDTTEKFDTAASENQEYINKQFNECNDNPKIQTPNGKQTFECITTCIKVQSQSELKFTIGPSTSNECTDLSDNSSMKQVPIAINVQEDKVSICYSKENQDGKTVTNDAEDSINNNMQSSSPAMNPTFLKRKKKDVNVKQISPHRYVVERSVRTHSTSVAMEDSNPGDFNEIKFHEKSASYFQASQNQNNDDTLKIFSETYQKLSKDNTILEHNSENDKNVNEAQWKINQVCDAWRNVSPNAHQNTSQNKGSTKEGIVPENMSFQLPTADLLCQDMSSNTEDEFSVSRQHVPILMQCVRDIFLGSAKAQPKNMSYKSVKNSTYQKSQQHVRKECTERTNSKASNKDADSMSDMSEICLGGYTDARRSGKQCIYISDKRETTPEILPVTESYVSRKTRQNGGHLQCLSPKLPGNMQNKCSIFNKEIDWKRQENIEKHWSSKQVVVSCGLSKQNVSLLAQNSPTHSKATILSELYSSAPWQMMEPDKIMKHYSDAINTKSGKQVTYKSRENISNVSRNRDSEISEKDFSERDCLGNYEGFQKGDLHEKIQISDKSQFRNRVENFRSHNFRSFGFSKHDDLIPSNIQTNPEENTIMASFENIMQQKRPYYVEHCGFRQKRKDSIAIDHCSNKQICPRELTVQDVSFTDMVSNIQKKLIANDNNSSIDLKQVNPNSSDYHKLKSDLRIDSYDFSDSDTDTFNLEANTTNGTSFKGTGNSYDGDSHYKNDDETTINKCEDIVSDDSDMEEDDNDDREIEEDEEINDLEMNNEKELASNKSSMDTDERESWYRTSDDEPDTCFVNDEADIDNVTEHNEEDDEETDDIEVEDSEDEDEEYE